VSKKRLGGAFRRTFSVLNRRDKIKIVFIVIIQIVLGALDLLGVLAFGLLSTVLISQDNEKPLFAETIDLMGALNLSSQSIQSQAIILGIASLVLLISRTFISIFFTRRILFFLSRRGATISADLVSRLLSKPLLDVQSRTSQETVYAITKGVESIALNVLATAVVLSADFSLLLVMSLGLLWVDPTTAIGTLLIFSCIAFLVFRLTHYKAGQLGESSTGLIIKSNEKIVEVFASYREAVVRNRRDYYAREIGILRHKLADTMAEVNFLPYVSKYVMELAIIFGAITVGLSQYLLHDAIHAVTTLAIFLAAGTRMAPAVLRVQQGSITIMSSLGQALPTLDLIDSLNGTLPVPAASDIVEVNHFDFTPNIEVNGLCLTYPNSSTPALQSISISIPEGSLVAIIGPSGAGKTTLIDVILGILVPDSGNVLISNHDSINAIKKWPGAIAYVPQDISISSGTIRQNVAMGFPLAAATDELVIPALRIAQLENFINTLPHGIDEEVGERGTKLSGGQRQRLGIARAMFTKPKLLVLDEATSSLDGIAEANLSAAIGALRGSTTILMIAHRLTTVKDADIVVYLESGKIKAVGNFQEIIEQIPNLTKYVI